MSDGYKLSEGAVKATAESVRWVKAQPRNNIDGYAGNAPISLPQFDIVLVDHGPNGELDSTFMGAMYWARAVKLLYHEDGSLWHMDIDTDNPFWGKVINQSEITQTYGETHTLPVYSSSAPFPGYSPQNKNLYRITNYVMMLDNSLNPITYPAFMANVGAGVSGYSGSNGLSGFSGYSGVNGASGFSGYSGVQGLSGFSGYSGVSGFIGSSGFSGYSGVAGSVGLSGYSGAKGATGNTGTTGASGFSGLNGSNGSNGSNGASGYSGFSGFSGYSGKSGFNGLSGFSGANGITPWIYSDAWNISYNGSVLIGSLNGGGYGAGLTVVKLGGQGDTVVGCDNNGNLTNISYDDICSHCSGTSGTSTPCLTVTSDATGTNLTCTFADVVSGGDFTSSYIIITDDELEDQPFDYASQTDDHTLIFTTTTPMGDLTGHSYECDDFPCMGCDTTGTISSSGGDSHWTYVTADEGGSYPCASGPGLYYSETTGNGHVSIGTCLDTDYTFCVQANPEDSNSCNTIFRDGSGNEILHIDNSGIQMGYYTPDSVNFPYNKITFYDYAVDCTTDTSMNFTNGGTPMLTLDNFNNVATFPTDVKLSDTTNTYGMIMYDSSACCFKRGQLADGVLSWVEIE